tara:strand:- start:1200 stop:1325 length:126 start_codon:yes stop_codon:yes gene_type:complete
MPVRAHWQVGPAPDYDVIFMPAFMNEYNETVPCRLCTGVLP